MGRVDITGMRFGRLLVNGYAFTKNKRAYWNCTCDCGNTGVYMGKYLRNGDTKSCGCQKYDSAGLVQAIDISGQRFGRLTTQYISSRSPRKWHCICDCGNEVDVLTNLLVSGRTSSCGCYHIDRVIETSVKDISGKRFGKLIAQEIAYIDNGKYIWKCHCDCGNDVYVYGASLRSGNTKSCGCLLSGTELEISNFLLNKKIEFQRQKTFIGCRDNALLKFDFYLPSYNVVIEYDGELHYMTTSLGNDLEGQQRRDAIKTKYCEENNIILLRIPYWEKDNIESILTDWLFLHNAGEANSSDVDLSE